MKKIILTSITVIGILASCTNSGSNKATQEEYQPIEQKTNTIHATNSVHKVVVKETIASGGYVYLKVSEKETEYWMAIPNRKVEVGATYYHDGGMMMKNFESKTLKRTFAEVLFAQGIRENQDGANEVAKKSTAQGETSVSGIDKAPNGIRIAELFENTKGFEGKEVIIKGKVVKVNNGIMGVNFAHLQDGTTGNGQYDITFTSNDTFNVDDVVTIKGVVVLNKDFGAGYTYDVIIEKAVKQ
jgi:hypothetical protein